MMIVTVAQTCRQDTTGDWLPGGQGVSKPWVEGQSNAMSSVVTTRVIFIGRGRSSTWDECLYNSSDVNPVSC